MHIYVYIKKKDFFNLFLINETSMYFVNFDLLNLFKVLYFF